MAYLQSFGNNRDESSLRIKYENGNVYAHTYEGLEYDSVIRMNNYTGVIPKEKIWFKIKSTTGQETIGGVWQLPGSVISVLESGVLRVAQNPGNSPFRTPVRTENGVSYNSFSGVISDTSPSFEATLWPDPHEISVQGFYIACHSDSLYGQTLIWENYYTTNNIDYPYDLHIESIEPHNLNNAILPSIILAGHKMEGPLYFQNAKTPRLEIHKCYSAISDIYQDNGWTRKGLTSLDLDGSSFGVLSIFDNPALTGITGDFTITSSDSNYFNGMYLTQETVDHVVDRYYYSIKQNNLTNGVLSFSQGYISPRILFNNVINRIDQNGNLTYDNPIYVSLPMPAPPGSGAIDKMIELALDYNWSLYYLWYDHLNNPNLTDPTVWPNISFSSIRKDYSSVGSTTVFHSTGVPINPYRDGISFP